MNDEEERWRSELVRLDAAIRLIAKRPFDLSDPDWQAKLADSSPLDEAGVRDAAESLLLEILQKYAIASDEERRAIRALVGKYPSYFWAATPPAVETAAGYLRLRLIHFAVLDQRDDPRDAVLWLEELCQAGDVSLGEVASIREEVAKMASDDDRYKFGSTRSMLLCGYSEYGRASAPRGDC